ncbi:hypothetical protein WJX72_001519 [[Myrmecia] bisecta]|uniref:Cation/H+ exchanger transmembrane domain-containing protein n=1 Tax=[Myrmecia] bisecta TaxID=41462 RepID=A0AAW1R574_9CHLO
MALALQLIGLLRGDPYSYCHDQDVTYSHRVDDKEHYNWCTVPESGFDAVLFGAVALLAASILHGKFSALWILLAGAACQMVAMPLNLGRFGNSLALWLGITPADLFLYVFLPPMLLDSAVRIDFYIFNKMLLHVLSFAFLLVVASTAMLVPLLLYAFNLRAEGWLWQHAALFAAMIAPTDPIAVSGLLKTGGGPEQLVVLMEGEALFNDASAITLFSIFFDLVKQMNHGATGNEKGILAQLGNVVLQTAWLAGGGLLIGLACGVVTRGLLKWMRQRGAKPPEELAITLAMAYLSFYLANAPGHVSGVIAVVSYGLYGSATAKWNMSAKVVETGAFELFWDTLSFAMNGIVFFYSGASAVNFFVRSAKDLTEYGGMPEFALAFWRLPLIFLSVYLARGLCILLFNPIFMLLGAGLELPSIIFATVGGLRGAVSLILVQMVVTEQDPTSENKRVIAQIALYTAGLVLLSLLINAPLIPLLLDWTGLSKVSPVKQRVRAKAVRALLRYTDTALNNLRHDEDEMLRGVDWGAVGRYVDLRKELEDFAPQQSGVLTQEDVQHITDRPSAQTHLQRAAAWTLDKLTRCCAVIASPLLCCGGRPEEPGLTEPLLLSEGGGGEQDAAEQGEAGSAPHPAPIREDSGDSHSPAPPRALRDSAFNTPAARSPRDSAFDPESSGLSSDDESDGEEHPDTRGLSGLYATLRQAVRGEGLECGTVVAKSDEANVMEEQTQDFGRDVPFIGRFKPSDKSKAHPEPPRQAPAGEGQQYDVENPEPGSGGPLGSFPASQGPAAQSPGGQGAALPPRSPQPSGISYFTSAGPKSVFEAEDWAERMIRRRRSSEPGTGSGSAGGSRSESPGSATSAGLVSSGSRSPLLASTAEQAALARLSPRLLPSPHRPPPSPGTGRQAAQPPAQRAGRGLGPSQPFITPHMRQPGSSAPAQPPSLEWVSVDLHQLERQQAAERRRARRQHAKEPSGTIGLAQRSTSRSAGKQEAHTRHRALHKALSGPLHMQMIDSGEIRDVASEEAAVDIEAELLAETRVRLVHGLKRYFHGKRAEGLLSARGVQILDHACDVTMDQSGQPMSMWQHIEREVCGRYMVRGLARTLFGLRKLNLARRRWGKPSRWLADRLLLPPLLKAAEVIGRILNRTMLLSMECAVEYWLALNWSPQAQWLEYEEAGEAGLREEVRAESRRVWQFILEREVEAPERFRSIQSYRAAMALLRQQGLFVEQLFSSGMVNEVEREKLLEPIEKRERDLEKLGSIGRPPTITEVLRSTPVLHELPEPVFEGILRRSQLVRYEPGNVIWSPPTKPTQAPATPAPLTIEEVASSPQAASKGSTAGGKGVHIVMAGLVKSAYINSDGETEDYYLGTGGVIGLLPALVGEALPGSGGATAVGNALMQGPVVFHIPQSLIRRIRRKAAAGDPRLQQLELDLFRMAALAVLDRLQSEVVAAVVTLFQQRTVQQAQRSARDRLQVGASGGTSTGEAGGEIAPVGADAVAGLDPKRIWKAAQKHVSTVMEELHAGLRDGALVELRAGQTYPQQSSLVLLRGTLCMTGAATDVPNAQAGVAVPQGSYDVTVQYRGPCVLPWLWDGAAAQSGQGGGQQQLLAQAMTVTAGRSGAVLVACPVAKPRQVSTKEKRDSEDEEDGSPTSQSEPDRALCPLLRPDLEGSTRACRLPEGTSDESAEHAGPAKARPAATASSNRMRVVRVAKAA